MKRGFLSALVAILLLMPLLAACAPQNDPAAALDIRLYQVLAVARKSKLVQADGEGEAIALINTGTKPHTVRGWAVETGTGQAVLPDVTVKPGQVLYLANDVSYFKSYWNFAPDFEYGADTDKQVPDLNVGKGKQGPILKDSGDVVRLLDQKGVVVDLVAYGDVTTPPAPWKGATVQLVNSFPITPPNQVITRMRRAGGLIALEPMAESWSGGTPVSPQRVYYPGQSEFPVQTVSGSMTLTAASAPDNAGTLLYQMVDEAKKSIRLVAYQFNHKELAQRLVAAVKRGVKVQLGMERNPGGTDMFDSDKEAQEILYKGGVEILYLNKWDGDLSTRFNPVHSKYVIVDDESVLVATGNFINSVYSQDSSCGNREWLVAVKGNADVVKLLREVWDFDFGSGAADVRGYSEKLDAPLAPDTYDAGPCMPYKAVKPQPLITSGNAKVTRILSPDNTMDRENGFLGLLRSAKRELLISANYIYKWWGPATRPENFTQYPQPYLEEIVAAARRGVAVQVILDRRNVRLDSERDNQFVVEYLNALAKKENLKLEARLINMDGAGIGRTYHNKSFIVDDAVVISSINGSENSFRYARELALKVEGVPAFTQYYRDLYLHDWNASARPNYPWDLRATPRTNGTFLDWSKNAERDVVKYEVSYKATAAEPWVKLAEVALPGYEDVHHSGIWGVTAVTGTGVRSNYAEAKR